MKPAPFPSAEPDHPGLGRRANYITGIIVLTTAFAAALMFLYAIVR